MNMGVTAKQQQHPRIVQQISSESIPAEIEPLVEHYASVTEDRDRLLWKWLWHVFPEFRLSSVPDRHAQAARSAKFCFSVFMTVLDDVSERHRDRSTFEQARKIPFGNADHVEDPEADSELVGLMDHAWELTEEYLGEGQDLDRFRELFEFDLRQSINTMDYNRLVNEAPQLASPDGVDRYDTHNMLLFLYVDIDLGFSPLFDSAELATLRDVTWDAQKLARIGNWVTTWERELAEDDYTSKVIVEAMDRGVVTRSELVSESVSDQVIIDRIRDTPIEQDLLCSWNDTYRRLCNTDHDLESVDVDSFVEGMRYLLEIDVKAQGYK
jgi:hypothetical protein